jgi:transketolase
MEASLQICLDSRSKDLRRVVVDTIAKSSKRGHIGAAFSLIEILRVLYDDILKFDAKNPKWNERDRFILSKGHGCLALYALLADKGFITQQDLYGFCKPDGILGGHPERAKVPGVEASTGSLGHGLPIGVGMAIAAKMEKSARRVFVVVGDGETNEGSVWEAAMIAGKHKLDNLVLMVDYNKHQSYSTTKEVQDMEPFADKWRAFNFDCREINGHSIDELQKTLRAIPFTAGKPSAIICHTVKGKGIRQIENDLNWHHKNTVTDAEFEMLAKGIESYS